MEKTAKRVGDRFEIGLLWRTDDLQLPESKSTAIRRLECVEKQMLKDKNFHRRYCEKIQSYVDKGYAKRLTPEEASVEGPRTWYLPHFGVVNSNKPDKLRLVFDAASKSHGTSLNDNLFSGPDLLQSLVSVLLMFRQRRIAFCSDVREMFHQVKIRPEDQDSQRFLWREGRKDRPYDVYKMMVMTFGATCSPTCAQYVKNLNAREQAKSEEIYKAIAQKHYVDDYLDSKDTVDEAVDTIKEVRRVQKLGGFELVNWMSNSKEVMKRLFVEEEMKKELNIDCDSTLQRVLGLWWDPKTDTFQFRLNSDKFDISEKYRPTKRQVLRIVMSIFDPLGLIVNFTIRGRMIIQEIWRSGIGWDDEIDDDLHRIWLAYLNDLKTTVTNLRIPRCYSAKIPEATNIELHVFCDASKRAFGAVVFLRVIKKCQVDVMLVISKAKVAPTKPISIPRLELQAALLGSRLANTLTKTLEVKIDKILFYSDSMIVLHWINNKGKRVGQFESHRIGEIQELTDVNNWRWIPSQENVADDITRTYGDDGQNRTNFSRWVYGPAFLLALNESDWPSKRFDMISKNDNKNQLENEFVEVIQETYDDKHHILPDIRRFSKWLRLIRVTAWTSRYVEKLIERVREQMTTFPEELSVEELKEAELKWIRQSQLESFPEEIRNLSKKKEVSSRSRLKNLSPVFEDGFVKLSGRTDLATSLEDSTKRPYILDPKHNYTKLLIQHYHEKFGHQGIETVINEVRQKFWVLNCRALVKEIFRKCLKCRILKTKPRTPKIGQLPVERLTPNIRPFTYVGIDYFGPMVVTIKRRQEKRWGLIFSCLTVRAVHVQITYSLTTDSTIMAIQRMIARRGTPKMIFSDNGTNFRCTSRELKSSLKKLNQEKLNQSLSSREIIWKFIPPAAPHMGGAWERLIRSMKTTFRAILGNQRLNDEVLMTLVAEAEAIVNTRPLTYVSTDGNDLEALTPNHFLLGTSNGSKEIFDYSKGVCLRRLWRTSQQLVNSFWKRWVKEYLPTLTRRRKWSDNGQTLKIGDVVIIVDDTTTRNHWKLGRVKTIYPGVDGITRVVDVHTSCGTYRRPVSKLCRVCADRSEEDILTGGSM